MIATPKNTLKIASGEWINYINIGLMLISLAAAYILPFELFLFSYAVLGPLHYLTEISWLDKKNYFIRSKDDMILLLLLVLLLTVAKFDNTSLPNKFFASIVFCGFVYALILLFIQDNTTKILLAAAAFIISVVFNFNAFHSFPFLIFAVWTPTIVHVFLFTGSFILFGALKSRSVSGIISLLFFVACAATFFVFMPNNFGLPITNYGRQSYALFGYINSSIYHLFGFGNIKKTDIDFYTAPKAVAVMRFIAFAYTYHYLNWFSKTSVIKWNQVSKKRMSAIIILWIVSVLLYAISYRIGFYALFLLSMLHVFLEFPLNHYTFIGIGKEISTIWAGRKE